MIRMNREETERASEVWKKNAEMQAENKVDKTARYKLTADDIVPWLILSFMAIMFIVFVVMFPTTALIFVALLAFFLFIMWLPAFIAWVINKAQGRVTKRPSYDEDDGSRP